MSMTDSIYTRRHRQAQGMTLVEVMIALVILSVGLLGLAGLQISGLRGTSGSNSRVQAVFIINDMAERMHANTTEVQNNLTYQDVDLLADACGNAPTPNCNSSSCTPSQLAAHDNYEICQAMAANLPPGATLTIDCDDNPCVAKSSTQLGSTHTLSLTWFEVQNASLGRKQQTVTLQIQP